MAAMLLDDLLDKLKTASNTTTEKGTAFEKLMASYFRTSPEYAGRFDDVYLWQEWPDRGNQHDHGIDIVARDVERGGWCAIQCKFFDHNNYVSKGDIDSFLSASGKTAFTSRIIVSTAKSWGPTAEKVLADQHIPVTRIGLAELLESKVDWAEIDPMAVPTHLPTTGRKTLRPHQKQALESVRAGLEAHDRGQLIMACGTGKTFTALKIAEDLVARRGAHETNVLFLVPSIQLLNQTLREWKQESETPFRAFAVCSDIQVGKKRADVEDISTHDLIFPATTDTDALAIELDRRRADDRFTVVFSTYQSIDVVARAQQRALPSFDLVICDEAHRTTGVTLANENESSFVRVHDSKYLKATKRLYMTATPRIFDPNTNEKAKDAGAVLASMDNEALFGPELHRLGFGEAVEKDLLTDYRVLVLTVDEEYVAKNFQQEMTDAGEIKLGDAAKIIGCWNGLAKKFGAMSDDDAAGVDFTPMRRAVAFAKDIKTSVTTAKAFPEITERHALATAAREADDGDESGTVGFSV